MRQIRRAAVMVMVVLATSTTTGFVANPDSANAANTANTAKAAAATPRTSGAPLRVAVYGDSIGEETTPYLQFLLGIARPVVFDINVHGGTNACDWLNEARRDARRFKPDLVVEIFIGNNITPCTGGAGISSDERAWMTAVGINRLAGYFPNRPVLRVGLPISRAGQDVVDSGGVWYTGGLNYLLAASSSMNHMYVDAASVLLSPDGRYTDTLPCAPFDDQSCLNGRVAVRNPDGAHLCPSVNVVAAAGVLPHCETSSPGAMRVAMVIADQVNKVRPLR